MLKGNSYDSPQRPIRYCKSDTYIKLDSRGCQSRRQLTFDEQNANAWYAERILNEIAKGISNATESKCMFQVFRIYVV